MTAARQPAGNADAGNPSADDDHFLAHRRVTLAGCRRLTSINPVTAALPLCRALTAGTATGSAAEGDVAMGQTA